MHAVIDGETGLKFGNLSGYQLNADRWTCLKAFTATDHQDNAHKKSGPED